MSSIFPTPIRLKSGLKIYFSDAPATTDRVSLSGGTIELDPDIYPQYSHPAFIPKLPWRQPSKIELDRLIDRSPSSERSETIAIVKFPESVISGIRNLIAWGEKEFGESVESDQIISHPDYYGAREQIERYIREQYAIDPDLDCRGLIRANIYLPTTTMNGVEFLPAKPFAGLHLDSWDYLPFRRRHLARNRVCINLGREARYFLAIDLTLKQIFESLELIDPDDIYQDYRGVRLSLKFMRKFPDYPVVKLAIYPGEAYIAPTENFIHDATSIGKIYPDWSMTFLGHFKIQHL